MNDYSDLAIPLENDYSDLSSPIEDNNFASSEDMFKPIMMTPTTALQQAGHKTWENPSTREIMKTELLTMMPQFRAFGPVMNALGNVGAGTLATTAMQAPEINNLNDLGKIGKKNLELNSLLQGISSAAHLPNVFAEIKNPLEWTKNKLGELKNTYQNAVRSQKEAYGKVTDKWGNFPTSVTPSKFLGLDEKTINHFTPDVEVAYHKYLREPTFNNLHDLQVIMGNNVATLRGHKGEINQFQSLDRAHRQVQNKINYFLKRDPNALNNYNNGVRITRDIVKPFEANETLTKAAFGKLKSIEPQKLADAIKSGSERLRGSIPENHYLNALGEDLNYKIARGHAATKLLPENARKWIWDVPGIAQNPYVKQVLENYINPLYYGLGREYISNVPQ